ncbi:hypothetical protein ASPTUDRAFT_877765 [Aspergillus tubingensis CBS 134.48]|uniref:Secreted protein n=1 Tax=Aspergillus tubingensis (strain CBS 134.48) TaxID=767770 RepID=A0A1L9MQL5_ASPTC|nr:hypothetical protein ASPTUDRAFT_877765 [Aspergillus tubingensis CBS 134.48]
MYEVRPAFLSIILFAWQGQHCLSIYSLVPEQYVGLDGIFHTKCHVLDVLRGLYRFLAPKYYPCLYSTQHGWWRRLQWSCKSQLEASSTSIEYRLMVNRATQIAHSFF